MLKKLSRKHIASGVITLSLIAFLGISVYVANQATKQDFRSKAAENTLLGVFNAESTGTKSVTDNLILPSVLGFQSDAFTGDASVSYSFDIPPGPGGLAPSVGLTYSSSYVADYATGTGIKHSESAYFAQAGLAGFGWQMTGIGSVEKSRNAEDKNEIYYTLNLGGTSFRLIPTGGDTWRTSPESFFTVYHQPCSGSSSAGDTGYWEIKDKSGTKYLLGGSAGDDCTLQTAANQFLATAWRIVSWKDPENPNFRSNLEPYKWMLRRVEDVHGNTISYTYNQEWKDIQNCPYTGPNHYTTDLTTLAPTDGFYKYTTAVYPTTISYNDGKIAIQFEYEPRPDWQVSANPMQAPPAWADACYTGYFAKQRIKTVKILRDGQQYSSYDLKYKPDEEVKSVFEVCPRVGPKDDPGCYPNDLVKRSHSLLQEVVRHGTNPASSLPSYRFTYNDGKPGDCSPRSGSGRVTCPNHVLLTEAKNGYGGTVTYAYGGGNNDIKLCSLSYDGMPPGVQPCDTRGRLRVDERTTKDDVTGKSFKTSYKYTGGLAKFDKAEEDLSSFDGYQFLGYGKVVQVTSENTNINTPASISRSSFYQAKTSGSEGQSNGCFNPDIKLGKAYQVQALDRDWNKDQPFESGKVLTVSENTFRTPPAEPSCTTDYKILNTRAVPPVFLSETKSTLDGLTTQTKYDYDQYGNQTIVENLGFINDNNDSRYSITKYSYNTGRNILNKPYIQVVSSDRAGKNVLSSVKTYYDGNNKKLGVVGDRGLATKIVSGKKNARLPTSTETDTLTDITIEQAEAENDEDVLGIFAPEVQAATQIKVYAKIGSKTGPPFNLPAKTIRLTQIKGTCSNLCNPSCNDPVCKNKDKTYNPGKEFVTWSSGTNGASYTFRMQQLDLGWKQDPCDINNYPQNSTCIIVLHPPGPTPTGSIPTATPVPQTSLPKNTRVAVVLNEYDQWGNVTKTTDPRKNIKETRYDDSHLYPVWTKQKVNGKNWITTIDYHPVLKKPLKTVDINGATTEIRYDDFGRVSKAWGPDDSENKPTLKASYEDPNSSSNPLKVRIDTLTKKNPPKYVSRVTFYNSLGQNIEEKQQWDDGKIKVSYTSYNSLGQTDFVLTPFLTQDSLTNFIKNPSSSKTISFYDMLGRTVRVENPDSTKTQTDYQANTTTIYDANDPNKTGKNKKVSYANAYGEIEKIEEYKDGGKYLVQRFMYDKAGRVVQSIDPDGHATVKRYDILGRVGEETNLDSGKTSYTYDASGNPLSKTDNKGQTVIMKYDDGNRVTSRTYPDNTTVSYTYDEGDKKQLNKLTTLKNSSATTKYEYNLKGELISETTTITGDPIAYTTSYTYDAAGRVAKTKYPDGEEVSQTYTVSSLPDTLSSNLGSYSYVHLSTYNAQGQLKDRQFGNNTKLTQNYYEDSFRLKNIILNTSVAKAPQKGSVAGASDKKTELPAFLENILNLKLWK